MGILFSKTLVAAQSLSLSNTLVDAVGMRFPLGKNARVNVNYWLPFHTGATGGFRFKFAMFGAPVTVVNGFQVIEGTGPTIFAGVSFFINDITDPWPFAGDFVYSGRIYIKNGSTAAEIQLQFAQNSIDVTPVVLLEGAQMDVNIL